MSYINTTTIYGVGYSGRLGALFGVLLYIMSERLSFFFFPLYSFYSPLRTCFLTTIFISSSI